MKKCSTSLIIKEIKIKMSVRYLLAKVCKIYNVQYGERAKAGYKLLNIFFPWKNNLTSIEIQSVNCDSKIWGYKHFQALLGSGWVPSYGGLLGTVFQITNTDTL